MNYIAHMGMLIGLGFFYRYIGGGSHLNYPNPKRDNGSGYGRSVIL